MSKASAALRRLEHEYAMMREEPLRRVAFRNELLRPVRTRQFHAFGTRSFVDRPAWLYGPKKMAVGDGTMILKGGWLAVEKVAWDRPGPVLQIGNRVAIRIGCTLSAAESIVIEDDVGMGAHVTIIDSKHTWLPDNPNPFYGPVVSAPIRVGRGSWLADRVTIAAGADIGEQCAIGPNSVVNAKVPDFSILIGNPGRIVGSTRT